MSSPFLPETNRGTEETLEALDRTISWASRINTDEQGLEMDVSSFISQLQNCVRERYIGQTIEREVDNFVFNNSDEVKRILTGNLDEKVESLKKLEEYLEDNFGYVTPPTFTKEELVWLVSQQLVSYSNPPSEYEEAFVEKIKQNSYGNCPERWEDEEFPAF
jgi:hypothetical protein